MSPDLSPAHRSDSLTWTLCLLMQEDKDDSDSRSDVTPDFNLSPHQEKVLLNFLQQLWHLQRRQREREREMFVLFLMSVREQTESWQSAASLIFNYMSALYPSSCILFTISDQLMSKLNVSFRCRCCPEVTKSLFTRSPGSVCVVNLRDSATVSC